jgi:hypothetical protein
MVIAFRPKTYLIVSFFLLVFSGVPGVILVWWGAPPFMAKLSLPYWIAISSVPGWLARLPLLESLLILAQTGHEGFLAQAWNELMSWGNNLIGSEPALAVRMYALKPLIAVFICLAGMWYMFLLSLKIFLKGLIIFCISRKWLKIKDS